MLSSGWTHVPPGSPVMPGSIALPHANLVVAGLGTAMAALGAGAAYYLTMVDKGWDWRWRGGFAEAVFESDFGWKIVVARLVSATVSCADFIGRILDKKWWDGLLEGMPGAARSAGDVVARATQGRLNDYLWWTAAGTALLLGRVLR